jgi:protein O-mannosyl-transferase
MSSRAVRLSAAFVLALLLAAYENHFGNTFHFDDGHSIVDNPAVRDVGNIPGFFVDATTFSILPPNQSYRPVLQATLAFDYWIAGGYEPRIFQIDSFVWFLAQLAFMYGFFVCVIRPSATNAEARATAMAATAIYALHPVCAETVNYIIQRGEILSTLGVVAGLWMYAAWPTARKRKLWIVPLVLGGLAKPPALMFPALLALYVYLIERPALPDDRRKAWLAVGAAGLVCGLVGWLSVSLTPPAYTTGAGSATSYWLSQPFVALRYFATFFAPVGLSADNDWQPVGGLSDPRCLAGLLFVAALAVAAWRAGLSNRGRPIAFGLSWFVVALVPTSITPLAEIANDHRMFFPFVGLSLAVAWTAALTIQRLPAAIAQKVAVAVVVLALVAGALGVRARNEVWKTEESLWLDVTRKSPANGRGWMNYGVNRMGHGDYETAIASFERGLTFTPNYSLLYVNLGVAYGAIGRPQEAERSFVRAVQLEPDDWRSHFYFARWLRSAGRLDEARAEASLAVSQNPADEQSQQLARELTASASATAGSLVARSLTEYRAGRYRESIASAEEALKLNPEYAEAYNNIAAGHNALGEWDLGISAAEKAIALNPTLQIARNNLAYAMAQKSRGGRR